MSAALGLHRPLKQTSTALTVEGVILLLLGIAALVFPAFAGLAAGIVFGWVLIVTGVAGLIVSFASKPHMHFGWSLLSSVLALLAGLVVIFDPVSGVQVLVLVIGAWLVLDGVSSMMMALQLRRSGHGAWGWLMASAVFDWILAAVLLAMNPLSSLLTVGIIVGIDLVFAGIALMSIAAALRRAA